MKNQTFRIVAFAAAAALVVSASSAVAQGDGDLQKQETDPTHTSDNPFLRKGTGSTKRMEEQAKASSAPKMTEKDKSFLLKAATAGDEEIALGKLGQQNGQNGEVKKIANMIVAEHSKMNAELMAFSEKKGLRISAQAVKPGKISPQGFDKVFLDSLAAHHEKDIALFQKQAQGGDDKDIKAFAGKTLPALKSHLAMVKKAQASVK